ncbi:MAG TPA: metallophosphoesterase [Gemmatimonadaceae bacterium]|nr:metallophosphoesterase [Gemmatimonadaceae bacterium]
MTTVTLFHCSDLHFGHPAVPEQYEAMESLIVERKFDVVAISGDVTQRARSGEFQRARAFIRHAEGYSKVICIPGNHDVQWWKSPLGLGDDGAILANYRRFVNPEIEPVLRVPGVTLAGLNTSHGVTRQTLTWRVRDVSIIGIVRRAQIERMRAIFADIPTSDARVIVMHHNPMKGELSQRHGLKNTPRVLGAFADLQTDLVLCGHDHQDAVHYVEHTRKGTVISTAGTVSNRMRGGRPSSVNAISISPEQIEVSTLVWSQSDLAFLPGASKCFAR